MTGILPQLSQTSTPLELVSQASATMGVAMCTKLVQFLRDAYAYVTRTPETVLTAPQQMLEEKSDFCMPLCESGLSWAIVNRKHNPVKARARTGLFSLLLFRGISFNSKAFELAPEMMHPVSQTIIFLYAIFNF